MTILRIKGEDIDIREATTCRDCYKRGTDSCPMRVEVNVHGEVVVRDEADDDGFCHKAERW